MSFAHDTKKSIHHLTHQGAHMTDNTAHTLRRAKKQATEYAHEAYPRLVRNVKHAAQDTGKQMQQLAGKTEHNMAIAAGCLANGPRQGGSCLIKIGIGLGIIKLLSADKQRSEAAAKVRGYIEEKPVESAILALGAGYVLGKLLR